MKIIVSLCKRLCRGSIGLLGAIIACNVYIVHFSSAYIVDAFEELPKGSLQTVIVPGAGVYRDGHLSSIAQGRVDTAVSLFADGYVPTILVSGDNGSDHYNEVRAMRNNLVEQGIDKAYIFQDFAGFDTYDTMYRAHALFEVDHAVVTTQAFHLDRAVFIARKLGIDARGVRAVGYQPRSRDRVIFREYLARVKAWIEITLGSSPKFLGDHIPIEGTSNGRVG